MAKIKKQEILFYMPANHSDDTPIELSEDTKAAAMKKLQETYSALSFVNDFIKDGSFTVRTRFNGLGLAQSHLDDVKRLLGADEDEKQRQDSDRKYIRQANQENQRLREEMANGVTSEAVGHKLYELKNVVYKFWQSLGFAYSKGSFDAHGGGGSFTAEFSVYLDRTIDYRDEDTPISGQQKKDKTIEELAEILDLHVEGRYDDHAVVDSPKNRAWIVAQLTARFPSIRFFEIKSLAIHKTDLFQLREIKAYIDIDEIEEQNDNAEEGQGTLD